MKNKNLKRKGFTNVGIKIAANTAITAITITNSTIVNPFFMKPLFYSKVDFNSYAMSKRRFSSINFSYIHSGTKFLPKIICPFIMFGA